MDGSSACPTARTKSEISDPTSEAALGGADAISDTPGISRQGTTPPPEFDVLAPTQSPSGNKLVLLAVVVALGIVLAYAAGMLR
jgi:hypothetical protein